MLNICTSIRFRKRRSSWVEFIFDCVLLVEVYPTISIFVHYLVISIVSATNRKKFFSGRTTFVFCRSPVSWTIQSTRIYGEAHRKHRTTLLIDSVVCTLLSERRLGPKVYGIFPEGRLEEFVEVSDANDSCFMLSVDCRSIQAECLLVSEIRQKDIAQKIARLLAELHQIEMPLVKEPIWLYRTIERFVIPTILSTLRSSCMGSCLDTSSMFPAICRSSPQRKIGWFSMRFDLCAISDKNLRIWSMCVDHLVQWLYDDHLL